MISDMVIIFAVIVVCMTSIFILISKDWRYCIGSLILQYVGVFLLVYKFWPLEMAIAKMLAGWMAAAILGIAMTYSLDAWSDSEKSVKYGSVFRISAVLLLALTITSLVRTTETWLTISSSPILWGSFILIAIGLLQISLSSHPFRVIIGLLTVLSGFEIIYATVETSTLVAGLLAIVNLGIALVGAYLLIAPTMESNP